MKVLVAMSGGIDSSMTAALLVQRGHAVTGVHLKMADTPSGLPGKGCCTLDDARDARRVADRLGIPFYVWDMAAPFRQRVIDDFVAEYAAGRTPNPCVRCNERVKYTALLARARAVGFDALATGHHVRLEAAAPDPASDGAVPRWRMRRATDPGKDQTYVLYMATQDQLAHTLWPAGDHTKADLRAMAAERGLATASKPDSHDICFIPSGDLGGFLAPRLGQRRGAFVGPDGAVLGFHDGAYRFTIGQRRGLGLGGHPDPLYVTAIEGSAVHVGPRASLEAAVIEARDVSWVAGEPPAADVDVTAQIRYRGAAVPAVLAYLGDGRVRVTFSGERPLAVAAGQAVVFYTGDECLGGATVVHSPAPSRAGYATASTRLEGV
ncbi:MAG: tRNA 2-thiouridine(34) synthase MnmA [Egibacteraceae bacterium]